MINFIVAIVLFLSCDVFCMEKSIIPKEDVEKFRSNICEELEMLSKIDIDEYKSVNDTTIKSLIRLKSDVKKNAIKNMMQDIYLLKKKTNSFFPYKIKYLINNIEEDLKNLY